MTVCIAAICDEGKSCVVAADREITVGFPLNIGFEHHERKIDRLTDSCVLMSAGNALVAAETHRRIQQGIAAGGVREVGAISELARDVFMRVHIERAEELILRPRGLTMAEFLQHGAQQIPLPVYQTIDQTFWNFMLNTEFLVAGVDDAGGHVSWVHYNGMQGLGWLERFDKLGYNAIGSGASHAAILLSLTGQHRDRTIAETVYNVYSAKVNAEVAPGVGEATDMAVITPGHVEFLETTFLERLEEAREEENTSQSPDVEDLFARRDDEGQQE